MRVKICAVKRPEDALLAARCGADAIGLLVGQRHSSPDFLTPEAARLIVARLPPFVSSVLVSHLESPEDLLPLLATTGASTVQIHSEMPPEGILAVRRALPHLKILKSFHVSSPESLNYGEAYRKAVDGFVVDTLNLATDQVGGTGQTHDWSISRRIVERYSELPVFLAGGLHDGNVREAIAVVRPYGVDVNSGTKGADGYKDPAKLARFISNAKAP